MSDAHYDKVTLLLPMSGSDTGTTFTDYSTTPKAVTAAGGAQTDTARSKFYGSSGEFNGSSASLALPNTVAAFGAGDWTIEWWQYWSSLKMMAPFDLRGGIGTSPRPMCYTFTPDFSVLRYYANGSDRIVSAPGALIAAQWQHIALSRAAGVTRLFVDGAQQGADYADALNYTGGTGFIARNSFVAGYYFNGWMQDFRVTVGVGRYTTAFTPPARLIGEISGTVDDDTDVGAVRRIVAFPRVAPTRVVTTQSASDGSYTLTGLPVTEHTVVYLDDDSGTLYNDLCHRVIPA